MRVNLCTNLDNGVGLEQDYKMLRALLESWGHKVEGVHYKRIDAGCPRADLNIFLEVIPSAMFPFAKQQWLIPNPEWFAEWDNSAIMPKIDKILCKTHDAVRIFKELYPDLQNRVEYIGFESRDLYDPSIPRIRKFLHVAGQSRYKNSPAVAYCFAKCFDDYDPKERLDLVFVGAYPEDCAFAKDAKNVQYIQRASDAQMKQLLNECQFHIIPAGAEGYGHIIHEGLAVGAVVITTDFPPMNEFGTPKELLVRYQRDIQELSARRALVGAYEVREGVEKAWKLSADKIAQYSAEARSTFLADREFFRNKFKSIVGVA